MNDARLKLSTATLVGVNLIPLIGVLFLDWTLLSVMLLFWTENVIIGVYNVLRMLTVFKGDIGTQVSKLFVVPFFTFHYGMFTMVHGVFVVAMFGGPVFMEGPSPEEFDVEAFLDLGMIAALAALVVSHGVSYVVNFLKGGEYRRTTMQKLMHRPYGRVVVLHLTILFGAFLVLLFGAHWAPLTLLVLLKIGADVRAHRAERRKLEEAAE